jgi:hypothetical protein
MKLIVTTLLIICCTYLEAQINKTDHFKIFYTQIDDKNIKEIADSLENNYTRIITNLRSQELPIVSIHFYPDAAGYREGVKRWIPKLPAWAIGNALGDSAVHMVSPDSPDVRQDYNYQEMIRNTIHEFAHCVSLHINRTIANKPRWLWESVAIYESNQRSDPRRLSYLVNQKPPALKVLNDWANPDYLYEVGYFITEYLVESKGNDVLNSLIKNNGNIQQTLNMDDEEFTRQWFAFVKKKYGI